MSDKVKEIVNGIKQIDSATRTVFGIEIGPDKKCKTVGEALGERYSQYHLCLIMSDVDKHAMIKNERDSFIRNFSKELLPGEDQKEVLKEAIGYCYKLSKSTEGESNKTAEWLKGEGAYASGDKTTTFLDHYLGAVYNSYRFSAWDIRNITKELYPLDTRKAFGFEIGEFETYKTPAQAFVEGLYRFATLQNVKDGEDLHYQYETYKNTPENIAMIQKQEKDFVEGFEKELLPEESRDDFLREALEYAKDHKKTYEEASVNPDGTQNESATRVAGNYSHVTDKIEGLLSPIEETVQGN